MTMDWGLVDHKHLLMLSMFSWISVMTVSTSALEKGLVINYQLYLGSSIEGGLMKISGMLGLLSTFLGLIVSWESMVG